MVRNGIEFQHVHYAYRDASGAIYPALKDICLEIREGEFLAVIGANGSGKTTLARHINGLLVPDSGRVTVNGLGTQAQQDLTEIRRQVGMVFQFPEDQIVATTVEDDVAFGLENLGLSENAVQRRVSRALKAFDLEKMRHSPPHLLSGGEMQRVALAGVLAVSPHCIVFDEPAAMLDPMGKREIFERIGELHREGTTVILITQDMNEALLADRIVVMHRGRIVLDGNPSDIFSNPTAVKEYGLELPIILRLVKECRSIFPSLPASVTTLHALVDHIPGIHKREYKCSAPNKRSLPPALNMIEAKGLCHAYLRGTPFERNSLRSVSFTLQGGTILGVAGANGSGKSTLLQHLNGLYRPQKGSLRVGPFDLSDRHVEIGKVRRFVGLAFQTPEDQFFNTFTGDEIAYAARQFRLPGSLKKRVRDAMWAVGLDFKRFKDRPLHALSGGEQRKVALASILVMEPSILVLDEPTAGLDPFARRDLRSILQAWREQGRTAVVSSQNLEDLLLLAEETIVMQSGGVALSGPTGEVLGDRARMGSAGLAPPLLLQFARELRGKGWPLTNDLTCVENLVSAIRRAALDEL
jgi:energy-coupling factor transporter ATPase